MFICRFDSNHLALKKMKIEKQFLVLLLFRKQDQNCDEHPWQTHVP